MLNFWLLYGVVNLSLLYGVVLVLLECGFEYNPHVVFLIIKLNILFSDFEWSSEKQFFNLFHEFKVNV